MKLRRAFLARAAGAAMLPSVAFAQSGAWPSRTAVKLIVPAPPGGPTDRIGRLLSQELARQFNQSFVVDNRGGAGGSIGATAGAKADPDGYTLTLTSTQNTVGAGLYANLPFDIVSDFAHISPITQSAQLLVVRADHAVDSVAKFVALAKDKPGQIGYASSGSGTTGHLAMELFQREAGMQLMHVPYKGAAPALQDLLGGVVPSLVIAQEPVMPFVRSGQLRVLAVSSARRSSALPDVPTFIEAGYPKLDVIAWIGLSAPKGTPAEIVQRVHAAVTAMVARPEIVAQLEPSGFTPYSTATPAAFAEVVRADTARFAEVIKAAGIKLS